MPGEKDGAVVRWLVGDDDDPALRVPLSRRPARLGAASDDVITRMRDFLTEQGWNPEMFRDPHTQPLVRALGASRAVSKQPWFQALLAAGGLASVLPGRGARPAVAEPPPSATMRNLYRKLAEEEGRVGLQHLEKALTQGEIREGSAKTRPPKTRPPQTKVVPRPTPENPNATETLHLAPNGGWVRLEKTPDPPGTDIYHAGRADSYRWVLVEPPPKK